MTVPISLLPRPDFAPGTTVAESTPEEPIKTTEAAAPPASIARSANPAEELSELFFGADAAERRLILLNLDFAHLPEALPIASSVAQEANQRLEMTAMQRDVVGFAQELERSLGIARPHARRLADDMSGETVVIAAKALRMPPAMLQRVLLFLNPAIGQSVARVYELSALYEEITASAVLRLLAIWQEIHPRAARRSHQAYHWHGAKDDVQRSVRRGAEIAAPAERRAKS